MRHYLSLFLAASFLWMSQVVLASNHDDDDKVAAPGVGRAVSNNSELTLCTPQVLLSGNARSFNANFFISSMGLGVFDPLQARYMQALEDLAQQTGNPVLFRQDHAPDYAGLALSQLEQLVDEKTLVGALDPTKEAGQAYFELETLLRNTSVLEVDYSEKGLLLCPNLRGATHLVEFGLSNNHLTAAPVLTELTQLERLNLSNNQLTVAPDVTGLTNLRELNLSNNQLPIAPVVIGLKQLRWLYLHKNQITAAPVVTGLPKLEGLFLSGNQLITAPVLTGLPNLGFLYLDSNLCDDPTL